MEKCPSCLREHAATTPKGKRHDSDAAGLWMQTSNDVLQPAIDPSSLYWTVMLSMHPVNPGCLTQRSGAQLPFHYGGCRFLVDMHRIIITPVPEILFVYIMGQVEVGLI